MEVTVSFGEWIRQRRRLLDFTQDELARRVGCAAVTIKKIELDERRPSRQMAELLANCLVVPSLERHRFMEAARGERFTERLATLEAVPIPKSAARATPGALPGHRPPLATTLRNNLPAPPTDLVGRDELVIQLSERLRTVPGRLLTLVGPPGIGKTRLALAVATRLLPAFADGVYFVPLAAINDTDYVAPTLATELGISEGGQSQLPLVNRIIEFLSGKAILLLFDNFEQVIDAATLVAELLAGCPLLRILVTSQETLRLRAEQRFAVPPLDPAAAVALFNQCAQATDPDFVENVGNNAPIEAICRQLDGLPLAIELIAARIDLLTPQAMLSRLQDRPLRLLKANTRDLPARHRTLRDALQRSYELLSADEQQLLCRLSVFAGGCELPMVEAICGEGLGGEVIDLLGALVNRSLVRIATPANHPGNHPATEPRFSLLETIRLYTAEQLHASPEEAVIRARHVAYLLTLTAQSFAIVEGDVRQRWLAKVEREQDNLRAALRYSIEAGDTQTALQLAGGLMGFWSVRSQYEEGRRWLAQLLTSDLRPTQARAHALFAAGALAQEQNDWSIARQYLEESLRIFRTSQEVVGTAETIQALAWVEYDLRSTTAALAYFTECLELYRQAGDGEHVAIVLTALVLTQVEQASTVVYAAAQAALQEALSHFQTQHQVDGVAFVTYTQGMLALRFGHVQAAVAALRQSLELFEQLAAKRSIAQSSFALGDAARQQGNQLLARQAYERAQHLFQSLGIQQGECESLLGLAHLERSAGNAAVATALYNRCLQLSNVVQNNLLSARAMAGLALLHHARGEWEQAAKQCILVEQLVATLPIFLPAGDRAVYEQMVAEVRGAEVRGAVYGTTAQDS